MVILGTKAPRRKVVVNADEWRQYDWYIFHYNCSVSGNKLNSSVKITDNCLQKKTFVIMSVAVIVHVFCVIDFSCSLMMVMLSILMLVCCIKSMTKVSRKVVLVMTLFV